MKAEEAAAPQDSDAVERWRSRARVRAMRLKALEVQLDQMKTREMCDALREARAFTRAPLTRTTSRRARVRPAGGDARGVAYKWLAREEGVEN